MLLSLILFYTHLSRLLFKICSFFSPFIYPISYVFLVIVLTQVCDSVTTVYVYILSTLFINVLCVTAQFMVTVYFISIERVYV